MSTSSTPKAEHPRFVVVTGIDASPNAMGVLETALTYVQYRPNAELHIVHAVGAAELATSPVLVDKARGYLDEIGARARSSARGLISTHLAFGTPWREILQTAANVEADLVIVGTHGRKGVQRLMLGSQAELVVRSASCPVIVVRPKNYAADVPEIEPPCPECHRVQNESGGARLWCEVHSKAHPKPHLHYEFPQSFGIGSTFIRP